MKRIDYKMTRRVSISCVFVTLLTSITLFVVLSGILNAQSDPLLDQKVKKAILAEEWTKVVDVLGPDSNLTSLPVARLIKGHACLALNRNNESLCLFLSVTSEGDLKKWKDWTPQFAKQNPKSAIACYFEGDAFARLEQWDSAVVALGKGLELDSSHVLILNARGVMQSARGDWNTAIKDLTKAAMVCDSLADPYVSLGVIYFQKRTGATEAALKSFNRALELSPDFALALNGRGCAQFALGEWDSAQVDFEEAGKKTNCFLPTMLSNLVYLNDARVDLAMGEDTALAKSKSGMTVDRIVGSMTQTQAMKVLPELRSAHNWNKISEGTIGILKGTNLAVYDFNRGLQHQYDVTIKNKDWQGALIQGIEHKFPDLRTSRITEPLPGGVSMVEIQQAYVDRGNCPVVTWAGLLYHVKPRVVPPIEGSEKK